MFSKAHKRYRDEDIAKMQRYRWNPYKEALLNPISGPLVGVPTVVPIDTLRVRLKAQAIISIAANPTTEAIIIANPFTALCNDATPVDPLGFPGGGAFVYGELPSITTVNNVGQTIAALSNAPFARAQFAKLNPTNNVRGRVVSACLRVCNISASTAKNGTFTLYTEPQHNTLQNLTADNVVLKKGARRYNASTNDWHTTLYHPVDPDEVDGWVWDPAFGPEGGVKTINANPHVVAPNDGSAADNTPGFMGIWYKGAATAQQLLVEMYVIAEYVGPLVQTSIKENEAIIDDAQEGRNATENMSTFSVSGTRGDGHTGHPHSTTRTK